MALAKRARRPETRQVFTEMVETWNRLAAETASDQTLFQRCLKWNLIPAMSEMDLAEPYDALPNDLKLRWGEYA